MEQAYRTYTSLQVDSSQSSNSNNSHPQGNAALSSTTIQIMNKLIRLWNTSVSLFTRCSNLYESIFVFENITTWEDCAIMKTVGKFSHASFYPCHVLLYKKVVHKKLGLRFNTFPRLELSHFLSFYKQKDWARWATFVCA